MNIKEEALGLLSSINSQMLILSAIWTNDHSDQLHDLLTPDYPFTESFDEVVLKVNRWYSMAVNRIALVPGRFSLDGDEVSYEGWHNPSHYWNGWSIPYFTKEVATKFLEDMQNSGYWKYSYDESRDIFILIEVENGEDVTEWEGIEINGQTLYSIGGQYLCWVTEENE